MGLIQTLFKTALSEQDNRILMIAGLKKREIQRKTSILTYKRNVAIAD